MPYIFAGLLVLNGLLFGYYNFLHKPSATETYKQTVSQVKTPVAFTNVSSEIPPMIGKKD